MAPSREELLSKLLGSIQSPITNLARVLNQIAEQGGAANCTPAASALETPSLITFGAPSTNSFASFNPSPVTSRTTLITLTLEAPAATNST